MGRRRKRRPPRLVRQNSETALSDFLRQLGWEFNQSPMLDHTHKIDLLMTRYAPLGGSLFHPIGLQVTQKRGDREKIATFLEKAPGGTQGPVLYAEIHGRVTVKMAVGLTSVMLAIWLDAGLRKRRDHGVCITQSGTFWRFDTAQFKKRSL